MTKKSSKLPLQVNSCITKMILGDNEVNHDLRQTIDY